MQAVRTLVLRHLRLACRRAPPCAAACGGARPAVYGVVVAPGHRGMAASAGQEGGPPRDFSEGAVRARVVELVKKFDKIDADKVTETADFQRDLSLDSLDRVELVMAFEQEFCVEIPDDKADKLSCCADIAKYIISESQANRSNAESS
uniref:Acyl carrier protein n=1 Tax=Oryza meridionalis TaxID=40149 RepID=A0A0E0D3H7_9ORYZ